MTDSKNRSDLSRTVLAVLFLVGLILGSLWVLWPFFGAIIWATMIVISTWPIMRAVERRLWMRRKLAVAVMTCALLLLLFVPLALAIGTVVGNVDRLAGWASTLSTLDLPPPPAWVGSIPLVGERVSAAWTRLDSAEMKRLAAKAAPYTATGLRWFAGEIGDIGLVLVQFLVTVVVAAIMYANGETAAAGARAFARRLAGEHGDNVVQLAARAIRGVALGVVVTAVVQSVLGGLGFLVVGVPFAALLTGVMFLLCIAQIGPALVLLPAVGWLHYQGRSSAAAVLLVWGILVLLLDNVLRPALIRRGANLPLLLIFAGVIGGLVSMGMVGIFAGPVILAVSYTLLQAWVNETPAPEPGKQGADSPRVA